METNEKYSPGYDASLVKHFQTRNIEKDAAFFINYLTSTMSLLDCGCGPGTITQGFATLLSRGNVHGVDIEPSQIEIATRSACNQGLNNVKFAIGSAYNLKFADNSFDAVFAHALLQHLKDPLLALKEMYRVLKPGGVVGVRDDDLGGMIITPEYPMVNNLISLLEKVMQFHGGNHRIGRHHRELLRKAGFNNTKASASCEYDGDATATAKRAYISARAAETFVKTIAIEQHWTTETELEQMAADCLKWGNDPDAFDCALWCEAVGFK